MDIDYLFRIITEHLTKFQNSLKEQLCSNPINTLEEYKRAIGQIEGITQALDEIRALKKRLLVGETDD